MPEMEQKELRPPASDPAEPAPVAVGPLQNGPAAQAAASGLSREPPPPRPGFWLRLRAAVSRFFHRLLGLRAPDWQGEITPEQRDAALHWLQKELTKSHADTEMLHAELARRYQKVRELETGAKELRRELERARSSEEASGKRWLRELEQSREATRSQESAAASLKADLAQHVAELTNRNAQVKSLERDLEEARRLAGDKGEALRKEVAGFSRQLQERDKAIEQLQEEVAVRQSAWDAATSELQAARRQLALGKAEDQRRPETDENVTRLKSELAAREQIIVELEDRAARAEQAGGELVQVREQLAQAQAEERRKKQEAEENVARLQSELAGREQIILELRYRTSRAEQAARELVEAREQLAQAQAEERRRQQEAEQNFARLQSELAAREQDILELRRRMAEAEQAARSAIAAAEPRAATTGTDRQLAKKEEEIALMRDNLVDLRRRIAELESQARDMEKVRLERSNLTHELTRKSAQLDTVRDEMLRLKTRAGQLESMLQEFYKEAVNPLTVLAASVDLAANDPALSAGGQESISEIKQSLNQVLASLNLLRARMEDLGVK